MTKLRCLFLGYNAKQTKIISFLRKKNFFVTENKNNKISLKQIQKYDVCISFGYRLIIKKNIIKNLIRPIINIHISYLPFNRGINPNLNSFLNKTPKGVSIHEIDEGLDTGDLLFRKKINFKINDQTSFKDTYVILRKEAESLFIKNYKEIMFNRYKKFKQKKIKKRILYKDKIDWNISIKSFLKNAKFR